MYLGVRYLTETPVFEKGLILFNCQATLAECKNIISRFDLFRDRNDAFVESFLNRSIAQSGEPLSLGERQRVQFIRAMATKPKVLFFDEAFSGIEENLKRDVIWKIIDDRSILTLVYIGHRRSIQELFDKKICFLSGC